MRQHLPGADGLIEMMRQDKKASAGKITFILVKGIGDAYIDKTVDEDVLRDFLENELKLQ